MPDALERHVRAVHATFVDPYLEAETFVAYVRERATGGEHPPEEQLAELDLAGGCARHDPRGIEAFERAYFRHLDAAVARARNVRSSRDDFAQRLRERLFVGTPPGIASFRGQGRLRNWVRAVIARLVLDDVAVKRIEVAVEDEVLVAFSAPGGTPEDEYFVRSHSAAFREAFAGAAASLSSRERNLLRHACVDGLTVDELGALYGVHRATAARWVGDARAALIEGLKSRLGTSLGLSKRAEVESVLRLIDGNVALTLKRYFATA